MNCCRATGRLKVDPATGGPCRNGDCGPGFVDGERATLAMPVCDGPTALVIPTVSEGGGER